MFRPSKFGTSVAVGLILAVSPLATASEDTPSVAAREAAKVQPHWVGVSENAGTSYKPSVVYFPSAPAPGPSAFQQRLAKQKGLTLSQPEPPTLLGRLYIPEGEPPFPAVVLLHGMHGIWEWNDLWAERLRSWGYAVLDVDSLTPRGLYRHNTGFGYSEGGRIKRIALELYRAFDAHGARAYLAEHPLVDGTRIAALGMSQGGMAAIRSVARNETAHIVGRFQAAVAFYPLCYPFTGYDAPLLVLIGEADEWTSARTCETNLAAFLDRENVTLKVYDKAHHVFDFEGLDREFYGLRVAYDAAATADAVPRIKAFLSKHLSR